MPDTRPAVSWDVFIGGTCIDVSAKRWGDTQLLQNILELCNRWQKFSLGFGGGPKAKSLSGRSLVTVDQQFYSEVRGQWDRTTNSRTIDCQLDMETRNNSSPSPVTQDFHCCCYVTREEFQDFGITAILIFNCIVLVLTSVSAAVSNLLVLVSIWRTPSLRSPSNVLIFSLAVSDLGVGLITDPIYVVYLLAQHSGSTRAFCVAAVALRFAGTLLTSASLAILTAISIDMYLALCLHLRYQELVTVDRMVRVVAGIWLSSITISLINIWYRHLLRSLWASVSLLFLLVTTTAYFRIFRIVRHHQEQVQAQQQVQDQAGNQDDDDAAVNLEQQKKSSNTKFLLYCWLLVCYLPAVCIMAFGFKLIGSSVLFNSIYDMLFVLLLSNSMLNPVIYCWRFEKIRAAVVETTTKIWRKLRNPIVTKTARTITVTEELWSIEFARTAKIYCVVAQVICLWGMLCISLTMN